MHAIALILSALPMFALAGRSPIARRDRIDQDDPAFAVERLVFGGNFGCHYVTSPLTGMRSFYCPAPCRLDEQVPRRAGEPTKPMHWTCPPVVPSATFTKEQLCRWKKNGRLSCPSNCEWARVEDSFEWQCSDDVNKLSVQQHDSVSIGWRAGLLDQVEVEIRSRLLCPSSEMACPFSAPKDAGLTLVPSGEWQCTDVQSDLQNCGGCSSLSLGEDCSAIPHSKGATCAAGRCQVTSCRKGYTISIDESRCVKVTESL